MQSPVARQARIEESERLARRWLGGDEDCFDRWVELWDRTLIEIAFRILGDRTQAEDARQTAWLKAYLHRREFRGCSRFDTWLFRIVVHICRDLERRRRTEASVLLRVDASTAVDEPHFELVLQERRDSVALAVLSLPEDERECLVLRHYHDLTMQEVAEILEIPRSTVQARIGRALQRLKRRLSRFQTQEIEPAAPIPRTRTGLDLTEPGGSP